MNETFQEKLARIGAEAEAAEADQSDRPIPAHVTVSRPGLARSRVLQVRLNPDEFEAIERIARERQLPPSTVAREQLLRMIRETPSATSVADELDGILASLNAFKRHVHQEP